MMTSVRGGHRRTMMILMGIVVGCATAPAPNRPEGPDRLRRLEVRRLGDGYLVQLEGRRRPTYTVFRLHNPPRVVLDLADFDVRPLAKRPRYLERGVIRQIRARQFGDDALGVGRVELTLRTLAEFESWTERNAVMLRIRPAQVRLAKGRVLTQSDEALLAEEDAALLDEEAAGEDEELLLEEDFDEEVLEEDTLPEEEVVTEEVPTEEEMVTEEAAEEEAAPSEEAVAEEEEAPAEEVAEEEVVTEEAPTEEEMVTEEAAEEEAAPSEEAVAAEEEVAPAEEEVPAEEVAEEGVVTEEAPTEEEMVTEEAAEEEAAPSEEAVAEEEAPAEEEMPAEGAEEEGAIPAVAAPEVSEEERLAQETLRGYEEGEFVEETPEVHVEEEGEVVLEEGEGEEEELVQADQLMDLAIERDDQEVVLEIRANGPIGDYNVFKLEDPARIVVDIWNVGSLLPRETYEVDAPWVQEVRIGTHPDKTRIVIDVAEGELPPFEAEKREDTLIVRVHAPEAVETPMVAEAAEEVPEEVSEVVPEEEVAPVAEPEATPVAEEQVEAVAAPVEPTQRRARPEVVEAPPMPRKPTVGARAIELKVAEAPKPAAKKPRKRYTGPRISLDFKDADIDSVLRLIAEVSGLNIVTDEEVKGTISIRLVNVPWEQALDVILAAKQLGRRRMDNIIRIAPLEKLAKEDEARLKAAEDRERLLPLYVRVVPINYANADDIAKRIKPLLSKRGKVDVDKRTNVLIIKDIERNINDAVALAKSLDTATPQVLIEAKIVEANTTFSRELGVQWGGGYRNAPEFGNSALPARFGVAGGSAGNVGYQDRVPNFAVDLPAAVGQGSGGALGFLFGTLNNSLILDLRLSALESSGQGRIISSPRITTLDNEKATIIQGVSIPYLTVSAQGTQTQFVDAALKLEVTPHITPDRNVLLDFKITKNAPDETFRAGSGFPAISKKEARSRLFVRDGETAVVGGIFTIDRGSSTSGVPVLSKIPILGWFFQKNTARDTKTELLLFITPRIVQK